MSKSRKKKNDFTSLSIESAKTQTLMSKYFFSSGSDTSKSRKRPSINTDVVSPAKNLKLSDICNDLLPDSYESVDPGPLEAGSYMKVDTELEESSEDFCSTDQLPSTSESTKEKLLAFTYSKVSKYPEEIDLIDLKSPGNQKMVNSNVESLSVEEIYEMKKDEEGTDEDVSSVRKVIKYTPLEKQYLTFQAKYPDAVLVIECGYKYRFFGKDAMIASKDLNLGCYQYHNFLSASFPIHRLHYHVRRLVLKGYKVGVIKQTESPALKAAGNTRNELFTRELLAMYSKATFIEGDLSNLKDDNSIEVDDVDESEAISSYLICINEANTNKNPSDAVNISCVAVQISSGDIFYSCYQDTLIQSELESYLMCINPSEIILPSLPLSKKTENIVKSFSTDRFSRIERLDHKVFEHSFALNNMSSFISCQKDISSHDIQENLQILLSLPPLVISCLSALKVYLTDFKVENILKNVKNMKPFSTVDHMTLNATTIRGLEILRNNSNATSYGTLWWCMNQTFERCSEN